MAATGMHATTEELLEAMVSVWSVPRLYIKGQLPLEESLETAVRRVGGWRDMTTSLGVSEVKRELAGDLVKRTAAVQSLRATAVRSW
jgi:hypothetical protein